MSYQLLPPPDLGPPSVKHLTIEQRYWLWADLVKTSEQLLVSGLRHRIGPEGNVRVAFHEWLLRQADRKKQDWTQLLKNLAASEAKSGD